MPVTPYPSAFFFSLSYTSLVFFSIPLFNYELLANHPTILLVVRVVLLLFQPLLIGFLAQPPWMSYYSWMAELTFFAISFLLLKHDGPLTLDAFDSLSPGLQVAVIFFGLLVGDIIFKHLTRATARTREGMAPTFAEVLVTFATGLGQLIIDTGYLLLNSAESHGQAIIGPRGVVGTVREGAENGATDLELQAGDTPPPPYEHHSPSPGFLGYKG